VDAPSGVALAAAAAGVVRRASDGVRLGVAPVGAARVLALDAAAARVAAELDAARGFARRARDAGRGELAQVFRTMMQADEAVGVMEEAFAGVDLAGGH
jgi:hypothetical protein